MKLVISASPHIDSGATTRKIMGDVLIALCPALIAAIVIFGWRALLVTAVCAAACVFFEWGFERLCHKESTIGDLSAVVTGVILAYNLPVSIPLWQAVFGCLVSIVAVKQLFGGIGKKLCQPRAGGPHRPVPLVLQDHDGMGLPGRRFVSHAAGAAGGRAEAGASDAPARQSRRLHRRDVCAGAAARRGVSARPRRHYLADAGVLCRNCFCAVPCSGDRMRCGRCSRAVCFWGRSSWQPTM